MSIVIPPPAPSSEAHLTTAVSDSHCASTPDSANESSTWVPAGVYVPIHRRSGSSTSTNTYVADAAALPSPRSRPTAHEAPSTPNPKRERQRQPEPEKPVQEPKPRTRTYTYTYTRTTLLSLAPSSLIYTSLRPTISPALLAAHPRILRARGDGVARALEMARNDSTTPLVPAVPSVPRALHGSAHSTYAAEPKTTDLVRARAARVQTQGAPSPTPAPAPSPEPHPQQTERRRRDRRRPRPRPNRRNRNTNLSVPVPVPVPVPLTGCRTSTSDNKPTSHLTTPLPPNANSAIVDSRSKYTLHPSPDHHQLDLDVMRTAAWRPQPPLPLPAQTSIAA